MVDEKQEIKKDSDTKVEEKKTKRSLQERKNKAKEQRSLASVRAKTRMGTKRPPQKETHSFDLKNPEQDKKTPRIPPRRIYDFWIDFQKRQLEALKRAGISTTGYKISQVKMLYDNNGKEMSVKISFSGGGSIEDIGNQLKVFHSIRRKKPRYNKLYALLQAIKERGWKAVEGDIPEEMRAIVLRACKAAGIPLQKSSESRHSGQRTAAAPTASLLDIRSNQSSGNYYSMTQDWGRKSYRNSAQYKRDRMIDELFRKSGGVETAELHKLCEERAIDLMREVFGEIGRAHV